MPWSMFNKNGQRKYLTRSEVKSFLDAARKRDMSVSTFCWIIAATGCRISEALSLTAKNIDFEEGNVAIECLKKRRSHVYRSVPLPAKLLRVLKHLVAQTASASERLWDWSRMTGYRRICEVMDSAGIRGKYATPKGLRHAFGVAAIQASIPLNLVQRWLGHADIKTTAIYTSVMGQEERQIASRMWVNFDEEPRSKPANSSGASETADVDAPLTGDPRPETAKLGPNPGMKTPAGGGAKKITWQLIQFWLYCIDIFRYFSLRYSCADAVGLRARYPKTLGNQACTKNKLGTLAAFLPIEAMTRLQRHGKG